jgi:hypothetical protein
MRRRFVVKQIELIAGKSANGARAEDDLTPAPAAKAERA